MTGRIRCDTNYTSKSRRMRENRRAEWGGVWNGCPLPSRLGGLGSILLSRSWMRGVVPAENAFWRILKATERYFAHADALSSSNSVSFTFGDKPRFSGNYPLSQSRTASELCHYIGLSGFISLLEFPFVFVSFFVHWQCWMLIPYYKCVYVL